MPHFGLRPRILPHKPIPRGIARSGPPILSYGFRPFFLFAGVFAVVAMVLWIGALSGLWTVGGVEGPIAWHAHEMLFGYTAAALGGFVLTAVPNWTGRLPVSGGRLATLVGLWIFGRLVSVVPALLGATASSAIDVLFLLALAFVVAREVTAGRNWQNLRVSLAISLLAALNVAFHAAVLTGSDTAQILRGTVALYVVLIGNIGGRIIPSFTRNYLARRGATRLPASMSIVDRLAIASLLVVGVCWAVAPSTWVTGVAAAVAALLNTVRLSRWRGHATWREPLLLVLHVGYAFIPLGYFAVTLTSFGNLSSASALHVLTVGSIGITTLAVMARASRGHTGHALIASPSTTVAYVGLIVAAVLRPLAEVIPEGSNSILLLSAVGWLGAFTLFVVEHAPILLGPPSAKGSVSK